MPADQGSNTLSNDEEAEFLRLYRQQKRVCNEANGVLRALLKRAKSAGMDTSEITAAVSIKAQMETDEAAAKLKTRLRYLALLNMPISADSLYDGFGTQVTSKTEEADRAWEANDVGYRFGRQGAKIEECPYPHESPLGIEWNAGWRRGQRAIAAEMGPDVKAADTGRTRPKRGEQASLTPETAPAKPKRAAGSGPNGTRRGRPPKNRPEAGATVN
jgi:ribosome modulation factor